MRLLTKIILMAFILPLVWACSGLDQPPIISQTPSALVSPPSAITLDGTDLEEVIVFNVSAADFGTEMGVTYTIQMDRPGNNFASPVDLGSSTNTTVEVNAEELNRRCLGYQLGIKYRNQRERLPGRT